MFDFEKHFKSEKQKYILNNLQKGVAQEVFGLSSTSLGFLLGTFKEKGVLVSKDLVSASKISNIVSAMGLSVKILTTPFENNLGLVDKNLQDEFLSALHSFVRGKVDLLIVLPEVLFQKVPSAFALLDGGFVLEENQTINFSTISQKLVAMGYERTEFVYAKGQFSIKGDTLQISSIGENNLLRVEFFGDIVEKISEISFEEKKFLRTLKSTEILSCSLPLENQNVLSLCKTAFFDEPKQIADHIVIFETNGNLLENKMVFKNLPKQKLAFANISAKTFFVFDEVVNCQTDQNKSYVYDYKELASDLNFYKNSNKDIYLFCGDNENVKRLTTFLEEQFLFTKNIKGEPTKIHVVPDFLPDSVIFADANAVFIGTHNLFKKKKTDIGKKKTKLFIPKINDFVVHEKHGIGKCVGLEKLKLAGYEKDYIIIEYSQGDKFYLPSEQADSLSAYSTNDAMPKLNKLGGLDFAKVKKKVYDSVKEMAFDLLKLYAKREHSKGKVYVQDDYLMEQFENAFPFDETPDQLKAIADIKADMESTKIMDRLVCGDVGFGKTEVALRAIYKAVLSGSQVAFLCPTTILAEQHYKTCVNRFSGFMVRTARFNRLMSKKEEKEVLAGLESGQIDVVCGTHKLLSERVKFKNLTLLVLDEEQRFGVEDKEKIKNMKNNIDVLALSATPIPRTLHMSLSGIRDISIIDTPPKQRKPIQMFVTEFDYDLIQKAIKQELARGGQVLMIYNQIETIQNFASKISSLVPEAQIGIAHGRLSAKVLEDSIMRLYSGEYQILISTTLIENGIDLPSANTLIVVDADRLGLAQAYQIRGRIGRSDKMAYAYFLVRDDKKLSDNAYKRLSALTENAGLGSGLKIAMADLDIRGAGNVLGKEQSGNLVKVGYELYYKLLSYALKDIKGEKTGEVREVKMDVAIDAFVPETYIENQDERLKVISDISALEFAQKEEYLKNLCAVFGDVPTELENLATIAVLKNLAEKCGASRVVIDKNQCHIYFYDKKDIVFDNATSIKNKIDTILTYFLNQLGKNTCNFG